MRADSDLGFNFIQLRAVGKNHRVLDHFCILFADIFYRFLLHNISRVNLLDTIFHSGRYLDIRTHPAHVGHASKVLQATSIH